jgi:predicted GIY-YIG superfamily endonuclease
MDPPVELVYSEISKTYIDARKREAQVKRWSRAKKEALISGNIAKLKEITKSR